MVDLTQKLQIIGAAIKAVRRRPSLSSGTISFASNRTLSKPQWAIWGRKSYIKFQKERVNAALRQLLKQLIKNLGAEVNRILSRYEAGISCKTWKNFFNDILQTPFDLFE